jgi:hypothetical protein
MIQAHSSDDQSRRRARRQARVAFTDFVEACGDTLHPHAVIRVVEQCPNMPNGASAGQHYF